jgi:hypothetical protein
MSNRSIPRDDLSALADDAFKSMSAVCADALPGWLSSIARVIGRDATPDDAQAFAKMVLVSAINDSANKLIRASKIPAEKLDAAFVADEIEQTARAQMDEMLAASRAELVQLRRKIAEMKRIAQHMVAFNHHEYPPVPTQAVSATKTGEGLPDASGIYFVWSDGEVAYVGQSRCLMNRARLGHGRILPTDLISFLPFEADILDFAECHYIDRCKPARNFGRQRKLMNVGINKIVI